MSNKQQTQQADDPSGDGWRWVRRGEALSDGDVEKINGGWRPTIEAGYTCPRNHCYRRRIEPQQPQATEPDDPSGPGWRWVEVGEWVEPTDMWEYLPGKWRGNASLGALCVTANYYRRRIEQPQPSDSEPETMEQLRDEVATLTFELMAERDSGMIALQQLREQVQTLTLERDRYRNQLAGAIEHSSAAAARQQVLEALQTWLRPVLELVAEHPEDASPLAVAVLGFLPGIASRLIEE
jgi:hypothetical protein